MANESVVSNLSTGNLIGAGISLLPALFKGISGISQKRQANRINPVDPNFQMNQGVINNASTLRNRVGNYNLPGYTKAVQDIGRNGATAFGNGIQGSSSGGDVLDLATRIAYGSGNQINDLNVSNAQGQERALMQSLDANAQEGAQYQAKNAYDREQYMMKLREKAGLTQSANENIYGAVNSAANVGSNLALQAYGQKTPIPTSATGYGSIFGGVSPTGTTQEEYMKMLNPYYNSNTKMS